MQMQNSPMIPHKSNRILVVVAICCVGDKGGEYRQTISGNCGDYSMVGGSGLATLIWRVAIWCFFSVLKLTPAKPWYISVQLNCLLNCDESNRWKSTYAFGKTAHTKKTSERWMEENGKCTIIYNWKRFFLMKLNCFFFLLALFALTN